MTAAFCLFQLQDGGKSRTWSGLAATAVRELVREYFFVRHRSPYRSTHPLSSRKCDTSRVEHHPWVHCILEAKRLDTADQNTAISPVTYVGRHKLIHLNVAVNHSTVLPGAPPPPVSCQLSQVVSATPDPKIAVGLDDYRELEELGYIPSSERDLSNLTTVYHLSSRMALRHCPRPVLWSLVRNNLAHPIRRWFDISFNESLPGSSGSAVL
jgi:hypothetical protein